MNCQFFIPAMGMALLFASQALQASSLVPATRSNVTSVQDSIVAEPCSESSNTEVVSHVYRYNSILSKTVTTEEKNDTNYVSKVRWNLSFGLPPALYKKDGLQPGSGKENADGSKRMRAYYPIIYFGLAGMASDDIPLAKFKSLEWGMYPFRVGFACSKGNQKRVYGFTAALGLSCTTYHLKGDDVFHVTDDGMTVCAPKEDLDYHKQTLECWSWRLPVSFQYSLCAGEQIYFFSAGVEGELRHHVRSRAHVGHSRKYNMAGGSLAVNPWACNLMVQVGTDDYGVFARYALTDFFDKNSTALRGAPFMMGFTFFL